LARTYKQFFVFIWKIYIILDNFTFLPGQKSHAHPGVKKVVLGALVYVFIAGQDDFCLFCTINGNFRLGHKPEAQDFGFGLKHGARASHLIPKI